VSPLNRGAWISRLKDETHSYVGATACRETRRRRAEGSSSERSRSRPRPRCPPRSRYPALPLLVLLRPPSLARSDPSLAHILARLQPVAAFLPRLASATRSPSHSLSLSFSLSTSFSFSLSFFVVSSIWSHDFARANQSARTKREAARRSDSLYLYVSRLFFFFRSLFVSLSIAYVECENLKASQADNDRWLSITTFLPANPRRLETNGARKSSARARALSRGVKRVADSRPNRCLSRYHGDEVDRYGMFVREPRTGLIRTATRGRIFPRVSAVGSENANAARHLFPYAPRITISRTRLLAPARKSHVAKGPIHYASFSP